MAVAGVSANRLELLTIADAVAREKNIDKEIVVEAIEEAIQKGAKSRYGAHHDIRAKIDISSGDMALTCLVTIVDGGWWPEREREHGPVQVSIGIREWVGIAGLRAALRRAERG